MGDMRNKVFKKFKKFCLYVDKDNYKEARNQVQKLIHTKKSGSLHINVQLMLEAFTRIKTKQAHSQEFLRAGEVSPN